MANYGKVKFDDLHPDFQEDILSKLGSGNNAIIAKDIDEFNGVGFEPAGYTYRVFCTDKRIKYSKDSFRDDFNIGLRADITVGEWAEFTYYGNEIFLWSWHSNYITRHGAKVTIDGLPAIYEEIVAPPLDCSMENKILLSNESTKNTGFHTIRIEKLPIGADFSFYGFDVVVNTNEPNLLPPTTGWHNNVFTNKGEIRSENPYHLIFDKDKGNGFLVKTVFIPIQLDTDYTFTVKLTTKNLGGTIGYGAYYNLTLVDKVGKKLEEFHTEPYGTVDGELIVRKTFRPTHKDGVSLVVIFGMDSNVTGIAEFEHPMLNYGTESLPFSAKNYNQLSFLVDNSYNKSSAIVGGNRIDADKLIKSEPIDEITNLIPNANFERLNPYWQKVFHEDFIRPNGEVANGWVAEKGAKIDSNKLILPAGAMISSNDVKWDDFMIQTSLTLNGNTTIGLTVRYIDMNNRLTFIVDKGNQRIYFWKMKNGSFIKSGNYVDYKLEDNKTYYVSVKAVDNIYYGFITENPDYWTDITLVSESDYDFTSGGIQIGNDQGTLIVNSVDVLMSIPDNWELNSSMDTGQKYSFKNGTVKQVNTMQKVSTVFYNWTTPEWNKTITCYEGETYTYGIQKKLSSFSGTGGTNIIIQFLDETASKIVGNVDSLKETIIDSDFVQLSITGKAPKGARYIIPYARFEGIGICEFKEPILVKGDTLPEFHLKESRCDLIALRDDGQVVTIKGKGESELGYRVEAENGKISKWYRENGTIVHHDRIKTWRHGTWYVDNIQTNGVSNGSRIYSTNQGGDDCYFISFVGTGIDLITMKKDNYGGANYSIDGGAETNYDFYGVLATNVRIPLARNLPYGFHIVKIRPLGSKNPNSSGTAVVLDAFDIYVPKIPMNSNPHKMTPLAAVIKSDPDHGWIRYDNSEGASFKGSWQDSKAERVFYNGSEKESSDINSSIEYQFLGDGFRYTGYSADTVSISDVYIDGITYKAYGNSNDHISKVLLAINLPYHYHRVTIKPDGSLNVNGNVGITCDAFDIKQPMHVIDLRKTNKVQDTINKKILEHENKNLHDAHMWGLKGFVPRERIERGQQELGDTINGYKLITINFNETFSYPPTVYVTLNANNNIPEQRFQVSAENITTTGFVIVLSSKYASSGWSVISSWLAIGY
ncbi:H-type lectin domain-containing protein [Paenibacillus alvei]|uniref:H-type lectin domain-containing protein n=1 Tax=Paenibacillus alvei TaxID=44250 RepID=UPI002281E4A9|nr:H-type lectin domain-containing protein [Paenibacillus alvei]MCY9737458.1 H-type lectin domain-containing protein [Paenibacillus alvei]